MNKLQINFDNTILIFIIQIENKKDLYVSIQNIDKYPCLTDSQRSLNEIIFMFLNK